MSSEEWRPGRSVSPEHPPRLRTPETARRRGNELPAHGGVTVDGSLDRTYYKKLRDDAAA